MDSDLVAKVGGLLTKSDLPFACKLLTLIPDSMLGDAL